MRTQSQWLLLAIFLIGFFMEVAYPQTNEALKACLDKADQMLLENFRVLCLTDDKINGGTEHGKQACYKATVEDAIGFMTISAYNREVFNRILNQRKSDREDCFKQYH